MGQDQHRQMSKGHSLSGVLPRAQNHPEVHSGLQAWLQSKTPKDPRGHTPFAPDQSIELVPREQWRRGIVSPVYDPQEVKRHRSHSRPQVAQLMVAMLEIRNGGFKVHSLGHLEGQLLSIAKTPGGLPAHSDSISISWLAILLLPWSPLSVSCSHFWPHIGTPGVPKGPGSSFQ